MKFSIIEEKLSNLKIFLSILTPENQDYFPFLLLKFKQGEMILHHLTPYYEANYKLPNENINEDFSGLIRLHLFQDILSKSKVIDIELKGDNLIFSNSNNVDLQSEKFLIPILDSKNFPKVVFHESINLNFKINNDIFKESWNLLSGLESEQDRAINIIIKGKEFKALSYSHKKVGLAWWALEEEVGSYNLVFDKKQFAILSKLFKFDSKSTFSTDDKGFKIQGSNFNFYFSDSVSNVLNQDRIIDLFNNKTQIGFICDAKKLQQAINRIRIILNRAEDNVELEVKNKELIISGYSPVNGQAEIKTEILQGEQFHIRLEINSILDLLRRINSNCKFYKIEDRKVFLVEGVNCKFISMYE